MYSYFKLFLQIICFTQTIVLTLHPVTLTFITNRYHNGKRPEHPQDPR